VVEVARLLSKAGTLLIVVTDCSPELLEGIKIK